jgi:hypothetical protein
MNAGDILDGLQDLCTRLSKKKYTKSVESRNFNSRVYNFPSAFCLHSPNKTVSYDLFNEATEIIKYLLEARCYAN